MSNLVVIQNIETWVLNNQILEEHYKTQYGVTRHLKLCKQSLSIQFCDVTFLEMKEQLSLEISRVTEIEQISIKGVMKLYFSCNLVAYFDLFIEKRARLCLPLHGNLLSWIYINMCRIYLKFIVVKWHAIKIDYQMLNLLHCW